MPIYYLISYSWNNSETFDRVHEKLSQLKMWFWNPCFFTKINARLTRKVIKVANEPDLRTAFQLEKKCKRRKSGNTWNVYITQDFEAMWKSMIFCQIIRRSNVTVNSLIVSTLLRSNVHKLKPSRQKSFTFPCFFLLFLNANFFWRLGLNLVKLGYSEKASKLEKNLPHKLWRYSVKLSGRLFQILWPSQNIQALKCKKKCICKFHNSKPRPASSYYTLRDTQFC